MPEATTGTIAGMKRAADQLAAANLGYDQSQRWSFYNLATRTINRGKEADCSSICGAIAHMAGYPVDLTGTFYTGNFATKMRAAGFTVLAFTSLGQVRDGDFLLTPGKHVEYAYGGRMFSARFDERGKAAGGAAGNQSGRETGWVALANRPGGWTYIIRPPDSVAPVRTLKRGSKGADVTALQKQLNARGAKLTVDGDFGAKTEAAVKAEQRAAKLTVDGQVGPKTRAALAAPKPEVPTVPTTPPAELSAVELLGIANCQSYDGQVSEASYRARARIMASRGWSVVAVCETTKQGRQWMCDELGKLTGHRWASADIAGKTVGVLWDDEVWSARSPRWRRFGNPPTAFGHGGMVQPLLHRLTRIGVDVGSIHVRPKDIATTAQKRGDVALATGLTKSWPIVWAGDFALDAPPMDGYMRVTAVTDTVKSDGGKNSRVDAAFIRGKIGAGKSRKIDPGTLSDHYWLDVELIIGGSTL